jgi:fatty-acyl-CoA synthase
MERFDAEEALAAIERFRITVTQLVPTMFVRMLQLPDETRTAYDVSSLRLAVHAAAVAPFEYHNDPEKTAASRHPAHDNWCTVGDVGYLDKDGYLFLTDRKGFMIISGGVNIYPQEVENALALHPKILDVAVIGVPDPEMGEQVKAVVQLRAGVTPSDELAAEIIAYVRDRIAHYKAPKSVDFVDELPRTATGKLVKRVLIDPYANRSTHV